MAFLREIQPREWFRKAVDRFGGNGSRRGESGSKIIDATRIKEEDLPYFCALQRGMSVELLLQYGSKSNGFYRFETPTPGWSFLPPPSVPICVISFGEPGQAEEIEVFELDRTGSRVLAPSLVFKKDGTTQISRHYWRYEPAEDTYSRPATLPDALEWYRRIQLTLDYTRSVKSG